MKENEALERIKDLRMGREVYSRLLSDPHSVFYLDSTIKELLKKTNFELDRLVELIYNNECEDSYNQNTGW